MATQEQFNAIKESFDTYDARVIAFRKSVLDRLDAAGISISDVRAVFSIMNNEDCLREELSRKSN